MAGPGEEYFNWLCAKVQRTPFPVYRGLLQELHAFEFTWVDPRDENRAQDGLELREEFITTTGLEPDSDWKTTGCSVLEMLVALSRRAWFQTSVPAQDWFWMMIRNLQLDEYRHVSASHVPYIRGVLYNLVWREYESNGQGGLFPIRWPKEDQRDVEIWYQLCSYIFEENLI